MLTKKVPEIKILWLTIDHAKRMDQQYLTGLPNALNKLPGVEVKVIKRRLAGSQANSRKRAYKQATKYPTEVTVKLSREFDAIITDALWSYHSELWETFKCIKGIRLIDQHKKDEQTHLKKMMSKVKYLDVVFMAYKNPTQRFHPYLLHNKHVKMVWLPLSIDPAMYNNKNLDKIYNSVMTGYNQLGTYPIRWKTHKALVHSPGIYTRIDPPPYPEKYDPKKHFVGKRFAKLLNQSKIGFACTSVYDYPVLKIFEIPACNCALFCDYIPELKELGFVPDENMVALYDAMFGVHVEMVKVKNKTKAKPVFNEAQRKLFKDLIKYWLHSPKLEEITRNGYELVHSRHTDEIRAKQLVESLKEIKV